MAAPATSFNPLSSEHVHELLKPLQLENMSVDYRNQYKAIMEFTARLRALESQFADLYSKISKLEKEIVGNKTVVLSFHK